VKTLILAELMKFPALITVVFVRASGDAKDGAGRDGSPALVVPKSMKTIDKAGVENYLSGSQKF
jgi:hypothetical protein